MGTLWELGHLRKHRLLDKVVFVMPRDFELDKRQVRFGSRFSDEWAATVAAAADEGLELPSFQPAGLLFTLHQDGSLARHAPFYADPLLRLIPPPSTAASEASQGADQHHRGRDESMQDAAEPQAADLPTDELSDPYGLEPGVSDGLQDLGEGVAVFGDSFQAACLALPPGGGPGMDGLASFSFGGTGGPSDASGDGGAPDVDNSGAGYDGAGQGWGGGDAGGGGDRGG